MERGAGRGGSCELTVTRSVLCLGTLGQERSVRAVVTVALETAGCRGQWTACDRAVWGGRPASDRNTQNMLREILATSSMKTVTGTLNRSPSSESLTISMAHLGVIA